ncbi:hypothetical protein BBJ28_00013840 [Nothophytophthora sp. Chile5]|nr:hypothetical protein BBJ28_00013840 [Nothophytophthora sp. Chile5]
MGYPTFVCGDLPALCCFFWRAMTRRQVCLWCWHQIKNEYNGLCPACRQPYAELSKQKNPLDREEYVPPAPQLPCSALFPSYLRYARFALRYDSVVRRTKQRKQREKNERRTASQSKHVMTSRKNLANVRVMQRNLVYVIGLPVHFAEEEVRGHASYILRSGECFGQYGKIVKAVVNKAHLNSDRANATASAYITFAHKEDALCCIVAIDGYYLDGSLLRASFGTTKYCNFFLRNLQCNNSDCLYLHELGDQDDSFTKEEMQSGTMRVASAPLHSGKAAFRDMSLASGQTEERAGARFPTGHRPGAAPRSGGATSAASHRAASPAQAMNRQHSDESDGEQHMDSQRQAQSAAAISKLRQAADDASSSSGSSSPDRGNGGPRGSSASPNGHEPYRQVVAGVHSRSLGGGTVLETGDVANSRKPQLRVDTSRENTSTNAVDTVVGPLEALKLATGSSVQEPAWAKPFPSPLVTHREQEDSTANSSATAVYSPFGLGFEGGIHRAGNASQSRSRQANDGVWPASSTSESASDPFPPVASTPLAPTSSSSSFASIDAIFNQRSESSEALAGLLGVQLSSTPLAHGAPLAAPPKDAQTSRFAFANPMERNQAGLQQTTARYELLDGTNVHNHSRSSFGGYDAPRVAPSPSSSPFPSSSDRSGFPPLGSSQLHHAPPPPHPPRSPFGGDFGGSDLPLSGSGALSGNGAGTSSGLAFLQQMLPNVNISFGGDYANMAGPGLGATTPVRSSSTGRGRSPGRRLFERSQSAGSSLTPDAWDGGNLSTGTLGFEPQASSRRTSSASPSFYDPALVPQTSSGFSSSFYGFGATPSTTTNGDNERLRLHSDFGGETFRHSGSLINNS